ncbi:MAG TPA: PspC domain-containing protein [Patescibacteria group bacterium]|nr:PspC domain-containing protein [Patescibacteria group bacterium]
MEETVKLYRSRTDRVLFGVCGGLGAYFHIDPVLVRVVFLLLTLVHGFGVLLYLVLVIIIPKEPVIAPADTPPAARAGTGNWRDVRNWIGIFVVILGLLLLAEQLIPAVSIVWRIVWPLLIILLGAFILLKRSP